MARTYVLCAAIALLMVGNVVGGYLIVRQHNSPKDAGMLVDRNGD